MGSQLATHYVTRTPRSALYLLLRRAEPAPRRAFHALAMSVPYGPCSVDMEEVRDKADKIKAKPGKACQKLASDPIKVVRGPGGALFITDHHHGADAWR